MYELVHLRLANNQLFKKLTKHGESSLSRSDFKVRALVQLFFFSLQDAVRNPRVSPQFLSEVAKQQVVSI